MLISVRLYHSLIAPHYIFFNMHQLLFISSRPREIFYDNPQYALGFLLAYEIHAVSSTLMPAFTLGFSLILVVASKGTVLDGLALHERPVSLCVECSP